MAARYGVGRDFRITTASTKTRRGSLSHAKLRQQQARQAVRAAPTKAEKVRAENRLSRARADIRSFEETGMSVREARQKRKEAVPEKLQSYAKILLPENQEVFLKEPLEVQQSFYEKALKRRAEWIKAGGPDSIGYPSDPFIAYHSAI